MQGGRTTDTLSAPGTAQPPGMREEFQIRREVKHLEFYGSESGCNSFHFVSIVLFKVTAPRNGSAPHPSPCPEQLQGRQSARRKGCTRRKADLNYSFKVPITENPVTMSQGKKRNVFQELGQPAPARPGCRAPVLTSSKQLQWDLGRPFQVTFLWLEPLLHCSKATPSSYKGSHMPSYGPRYSGQDTEKHPGLGSAVQLLHS